MPSHLEITPRKTKISVKGGKSKHRLKCVGDGHLAFKFMVSSKRYKLYTFDPVAGFLAPGEHKDVIIRRLPGGSKTKDIVRIVYIPAKKGSNLDEIFTDAEYEKKVKIKVKVVDADDEDLVDTFPKGEGNE